MMATNMPKRLMRLGLGGRGVVACSVMFMLLVDCLVSMFVFGQLSCDEANEIVMM